MINKNEYEKLLKKSQYEQLKSFRVENAVIMAAGLSSRFAPISDYKPKSLCLFRGEILIERQIRQLFEVGIKDIYLVVGYKKEMFEYLKERYQIHFIENPNYRERNNTGSLLPVIDILSNTYLCSSDNYFFENPFHSHEYRGFYSSIFQEGKTDEWCISTKDGIISEVHIGGESSYVMMGHAYFDRNFSKQFVKLLIKHYEDRDIKDNVWEYLYIKHLNQLKLELKVYETNQILEFDTVKEAILYDEDFLKNNLPSNFGDIPFIS